MRNKTHLHVIVPMLSSHTLISTLPSPCSHPHDIVPSLPSTCSELKAPIPMHRSPSYKIDILPSQCYRNNIYKHIRFYLLFFLMSSSPPSHPTLSSPGYSPHATITSILSPSTHPNIPNPTLPMSPTEKKVPENT